MPVAIREKLLTDRRILHYMLLGFYGPERKAEAEREVAERKKARVQRKPSLTVESIFKDLL